MSATLADLATRGLEHLDERVVIKPDGHAEFPVLWIGRRITSEDVAAVLDDE